MFLKQRGEDNVTIEQLLERIKVILRQAPLQFGNPAPPILSRQVTSPPVATGKTLSALLSSILSILRCNFFLFCVLLPSELAAKVKRSLEIEEVEDEDIKSLTSSDWRSMEFKIGEIKKIEKAICVI